MESVLISIASVLIPGLLGLISVLMKRNQDRTEKTLESLTNSTNALSKSISKLEQFNFLNSDHCKNVHFKIDNDIDDIQKILTKNYGDIKAIKNELNMS